MRKKQSVCIIGAGIGGLTAGALLIKKGYDVTIYEKEPLPGGRALSFRPSLFTLAEYRDVLSRHHMEIPFSTPSLESIFSENMLQAYTLDLGYHAIGGNVLSANNSILSELGIQTDFIRSRVGFIREDGYDFPFISIRDMIRISPNIFRLLFAGEKTMSRLDSVSMTETISRYGKGKMKLILEVFSRSITTVNNLDRISAGEVFRSLKNLYKASKSVGYPKMGLGAVHAKLSDFIVSNGGKMHLHTPVEKILIKNNQAKGVVVNGTSLYYDVIVSNILVQHLFSLAGESAFPADYVSSLKSLSGTGSLCAYYSLTEVKQELLGKTFHFIERDSGLDGNDAVGMIDFMVSAPESGMSPAGSFLVQAYIICTPEEAKDKTTQKKLKALLDKNLQRLIPDYSAQLNWALYTSVSHLDGVAKTTENIKPEIQTPVKQLFLIGDCVKAPGIGYNCAINAAKMFVDSLTVVTDENCDKGSIL